jgi:hypothetical protein
MVVDGVSGDDVAPAAFAGADSAPAINPYAGGSGGGTLAHRIATSYLADMLLGDGRPETDELPVVRVAFQTDPDPVDDIRIEAERDGDRVVVHIAARRKPNFIKSHKKTAELVSTLLDQIDTFGDNEHAYVAVAFAGITNPLREVQQLASLARDDGTEAAFHAQVHRPGRFKSLATRYGHVTGLVLAARPETANGDLRGLVWSLLRRLWVLDFRVESDDELDWVAIGNRLNVLARDGKTGADVRHALHSACATQFDQKGTEVDRSVVRRKVHSVLAPDRGRSPAAWAQLGEEQKSALVAVQHSLAGTLELPRTKLRGEVQAELAAAGVGPGALLITGESGTGKSALTLSAAEGLSAAHDEFEFVALNLRRTRESVAALSSDLGMPLADVLREMSATSRVLVLDAADAALEGRGLLLRELAAAAHEAGVGLALVAADTAVAEVAGTLTGLYPEPRKVDVPGLDDLELKVVGFKVPALAGALRNLPSKSLYRRFVVVDLLARTGATVSTALDDWGCLELIWNELIGRTVPGKSSGEARTQALLALSEDALRLPAAERTYPPPEPSAIEDLRADLLVAPRNLTKRGSEFAHDEVRRFATAIRLAQADSLTDTLQMSGPVRWAMSAAKLACEGKLAAAPDPDAEFAALVAKFDALGEVSAVRWKDVPLEAALEMPNAFALLNNMLRADPDRADDLLATFVRVVSVHHRHNEMIDVTRGEPVARLLVQEDDEPWDRENDAFYLLLEWLNSAILEHRPAGNPARIALRESLLEHWHAHHTPKAIREAEAAETETVYNIFHGYTTRRRPMRTLSYRITQERYVQLLALLGPDIDEDVRTCLREIADDSPSHLQPAVDFPWSAWGLALHDPHFLLELTDAYYIEREARGHRRFTGIRDHQIGGMSRRGLSYWGYGPFWVMTQWCEPSDWIPVMNRMLNHAANIRCRSDDDPGSVDDGSTFILKIDGTERAYVGDTAIWSWYRGNGNGPYPCMSALQAVERWVDRMVAEGVALKDIASHLLNGCENLAMPGLIVGALIRHIDKNPDALVPYLREPLVWQFDSIRVNTDAVGLMRATDEGIANPGRRTWYVRDVAGLMVVGADAERRIELKELGEQLVANASRFDASETTVRGWAASLDATNMRTEPVDGGQVRVTFEQPAELEAEVAPMRAEWARYNSLLGIQNKYWIPARRKSETWTPPTPDEIAEDLAQAKELYEDPPSFAGTDPLLAGAYVAAAAVKAAASGHPEAFGDNATFAITTVLGVLNHYADSGEDAEDSLAFENDLGTRGAAAAAVPLLLMPALADQIRAAGATEDDVAAAAATLGPFASAEACLQFARSFDAIWAHPCTGDPCIHATAYQWAIDLARVCEIGEFDESLQYNPRMYIEGDVVARVPQIHPGQLDTPRLSATIRALGRASSSPACVADAAHRDLAILLGSQATAMVHQESADGGPFFIDGHGAQTISAARALLQNRTHSDAPEDLLLTYLTTLAPDTHLLSGFLRDLAAVGAETQELADAAAEVWPAVITHVLDQAELHRSNYDTHQAFNDYALSHLLPNLDGAPEGQHNELGRGPFSWVNADEIAEFIPRWLPWAAGRSACLLELIRFLRQLPVERQVTDGLQWIADLCTSNPGKQLATYAPMDEWLVEIKVEADARGAGEEWLRLVDRLVYLGNKTLAGYSR